MPMVTSMALLTTFQKLPVTHVQNGDVSVPHCKQKPSPKLQKFLPHQLTGPSITSSNGGILDRSNRPHQRSCTSDRWFPRRFPSQENAPKLVDLHWIPSEQISPEVYDMNWHVFFGKMWVNLWISEESIYHFGGPYHTIDGSISRSTTAKDHLTVDGIMAPPGQWQNPANSPAQRWRFVEIPIIYRSFKSTIPGGWEWEFWKPSTLHQTSNQGESETQIATSSWNGACKVSWVNPLIIQLALWKRMLWGEIWVPLEFFEAVETTTCIFFKSHPPQKKMKVIPKKRRKTTLFIQIVSHQNAKTVENFNSSPWHLKHATGNSVSMAEPLMVGRNCARWGLSGLSACLLQVWRKRQVGKLIISLGRREICKFEHLRG